MLPALPDFDRLSRYDPRKSYLENYDAAPQPVLVDVPKFPGRWQYCGLDVDSPVGVPAGPLLNGKWCLYYASLGFDVLTYKTVRSAPRECYPLPNLVPVDCGDLQGDESRLPAIVDMKDSWAVSFGMPSKAPEVWRADIRQTRDALPAGKLLSVSVVGTIQPGWSIQELADDYALCARWAVENGADAIEANFSCPNVSTQDGQLCQTPTDAALVASTIRKEIGSTPLIIKIGHVDPAQIPTLVNALGATINALSMTNSVAATIVDQSGNLLFDGQRRGICGNGCREFSLSQIRQFRAAIESAKHNLDIIGVGGAFHADHVRQYLDAGANAVQLATAAMLDPWVAIKIKSEF
jgi:dihydroorotate dehydrogenase